MKITIYGLVASGDSIYRPFYKTTNLNDAKAVKKDLDLISIVQYDGYTRRRHGRDELVIIGTSR